MLDDIEKTISMSQLVRDAERIARDIETSGTIYQIKRRGHRPMLLIDARYRESLLATIEIMSRPNWREEWAESERDIAEGRGRYLEDVVKELGLEGASHSARRKPARRTSSGSALS